MSVFRLILKELAFRRGNFVLSALGVFVAVALFVFFQTANEGAYRETTRTMRDIGMNLRIISADTDMEHFWMQGFSDRPMPERYVDEMAEHSGLSYAHLLPVVEQRVTWRDRQVLLVGVRPEVAPPGHNKPSMSLEPGQGEIYVGHELARRFDIEPAATLDVLGAEFRVARILEESGTSRDITLFGHLHDIQPLIGMEDQITEIQAINCLCFDKDKDALSALRAQLKEVLPGTKVLQMREIAEARRKQRYMVRDYMAMIMPTALVMCTAWIGLLAMMNVRERRHEIGVMHALGYYRRRIAALFLGRAVVVGLIGAAVGFAAGTWLALVFGEDVFKVTIRGLRPMYDLLGWSLVAAPVFSSVAALVPTALAVTQPPAVMLRDE